MFIKKIFQDQADASVHRQFVRFGKGNYPSRAVINARFSGTQLKISSTYEFANDLVEFCSSIAAKLNVSGIILSKEKLNLENEKKKSGIFSYEINKDIGNLELKELTERAYATLLDCNAQGIELKIKKKLPKPGKSGGAKVNDKFCVLDLDMKFYVGFKEEFFWDIPGFKKARADHVYLIKDIIVSKELEKEKNFDKIRQEAKRKGILTRKVLVDGKEFVKDKEFEV